MTVERKGALATNKDNTQTLEWRSFPPEEPPRVGVFFDMDLSEDRVVEVNSNGYLTVRMNEGATDHGYAWVVPTEAEWDCVELVDPNFGDYITGVKQWLFQARDVTEHCTDFVTLQRSEAWEDCPLCEDTYEIAVSPAVAADPTAVEEDIFDDDDDEFTKAAKQICNDDD